MVYPPLLNLYLSSLYQIGNHNCDHLQQGIGELGWFKLERLKRNPKFSLLSILTRSFSTIIDSLLKSFSGVNKFPLKNWLMIPINYFLQYTTELITQRGTPTRESRKLLSDKFTLSNWEAWSIFDPLNWV